MYDPSYQKERENLQNRYRNLLNISKEVEEFHTKHPDYQPSTARQLLPRKYANISDNLFSGDAEQNKDMQAFYNAVAPLMANEQIKAEGKESSSDASLKYALDLNDPLNMTKEQMKKWLNKKLLDVRMQNVELSRNSGKPNEGGLALTQEEYADDIRHYEQGVKMFSALPTNEKIAITPKDSHLEVLTNDIAQSEIDGIGKQGAVLEKMTGKSLDKIDESDLSKSLDNVVNVSEQAVNSGKMSHFQRTALISGFINTLLGVGSIIQPELAPFLGRTLVSRLVSQGVIGVGSGMIANKTEGKEATAGGAVGGIGDAITGVVGSTLGKGVTRVLSSDKSSISSPEEAIMTPSSGISKVKADRQQEFNQASENAVKNEENINSLTTAFKEKPDWGRATGKNSPEAIEKVKEFVEGEGLPPNKTEMRQLSDILVNLKTDDEYGKTFSKQTGMTTTAGINILEHLLPDVIKNETDIFGRITGLKNLDYGTSIEEIVDKMKGLSPSEQLRISPQGALKALPREVVESLKRELGEGLELSFSLDTLKSLFKKMSSKNRVAFARELKKLVNKLDLEKFKGQLSKEERQLLNRYRGK